MSSLIKYEARKERSDSAANWTSNNPTPLEGEWCLETDTDNWKVGDGSTAWNSLDYTGNPLAVYDISSANQTMTLPKVTGTGQTYDFFWSGGDGTYTATLAVTNSETVGGITAGTWTGEGEGNISCVSDGTNWVVKVYTDTLEIADSGVNSDRVYKKFKDGTATVEGVHADTLDITTGSVGWFVGSGTATYGITTIAAPTKVKATSHVTTGPFVSTLTHTTTTMSVRYYRGGTNAAVDVESSWIIDIRWRT